MICLKRLIYRQALALPLSTASRWKPAPARPSPRVLPPPLPSLSDAAEKLRRKCQISINTAAGMYRLEIGFAVDVRNGGCNSN